MKGRIYLDACIFIAQFKADSPATVMPCIRTLFADIQSGKYYALTSSISLIEVLADAEHVLTEVMDGRKGELLDASFPVMHLAREIRKKIKVPTQGSNSRVLDLPDCIHIASAKLYECEYLVTVDYKTLLVVKAEIERHYKVKLREPCEITAGQLALL